MPTTEKEQRVRELTEAIARSKSIVLANFSGMNVEMVTKMRRRLRDAKVEFIVEKNTLAKRALAESGVKDLDPFLEGPTGIALGQDEIAGAKILAEFSKEFEKPALKAAFVGGQLYSADGIKILAQLPPREVLLGQLIGALRSPLQSFTGVLTGSIRQLVGTIDAVGKKKQS